MKQLVETKLSYIITGLCFKVHNDLGRFCRERQYADKLEELLKASKTNYSRESEIFKTLNDMSPRGNRTDFIIENKIILELKAKRFITREDYCQMQRYLQAANVELGLLINFGTMYLKPKRILNTKMFDKNPDHSDKYS